MNFFKFIFSGLMFLSLVSSHVYGELITAKLISDADKKYKTFAKNRFISIKKELLNDLKNKSDMEKLNAVNDWYNFMQYKSDMYVYGVSDYWATLYEFVGKGMGDCEDYTIAKYYTLKELGIDPHRMKFTYVVYKDRSGKNISHMVLTYFRIPRPKNRNDILILGNINTRVLPASKRPDIVKVVKMINGDTGPKSKKWKELDFNMKRKKL
jgi:predicted transglutaminase-like cysteine proteinase